MFLAQVLTDPAVTTPGASIDLKPLFEQIIAGVGALLLAVLTGLAGMAVAWFSAKTGLIKAQKVDVIQQSFSEQLAHMMAFAETVAKEHIPHDGKIEIDNPFLRAAADYGLKMYPDTIGKLDFDAIGKAIVSRLPSGPMAAKAEAITVAKAGVAPIIPVAPVVIAAPADATI